MEKEKDRGEVVLYQPNDTIRLEVRLEQETVWLTQDQISILFGKDRSVITRHIKNIFNQGELDSKSNVHFLHIPNSDKPVKFYNLDVILSVGYRVHSTQGILFRRWSSSVLKQYLLRGYSINQQLIQMEDRIDRRLESQHDEIQRIKEIQEKQQSQIDFFVRTSLPPVEGVFFDGQMWDAYELISKLIKSARQRIILIDNYVDDSVLTLLDKRFMAQKYAKNQRISDDLTQIATREQISLAVPAASPGRHAIPRTDSTPSNIAVPTTLSQPGRHDIPRTDSTPNDINVPTLTS